MKLFKLYYQLADNPKVLGFYGVDSQGVRHELTIDEYNELCLSGNYKAVRKGSGVHTVAGEILETSWELLQ